MHWNGEKRVLLSLGLRPQVSEQLCSSELSQCFRVRQCWCRRSSWCWTLRINSNVVVRAGVVGFCFFKEGV